MGWCLVGGLLDKAAVIVVTYFVRANNEGQLIFSQEGVGAVFPKLDASATL